MKRGLVFAKYGSLAASTRQRFVQTIPYLREEGMEIDICPLFDNDYLQRFFQEGKHRALAIVQSYGRRLLDLLCVQQYDFLWVQYELFPYLPGPIDAVLKFANKPIILDFDDAIFHQYDQHPNKSLRTLLSKKLVPLLQVSDLAFCGNHYLKKYAKQYCKRTEIIPTTLDIKTYVPKEKPAGQKPILGWIGSPSTWEVYCLPIAKSLLPFIAEEKLSMLVIGAGHATDQQLPFNFREWSESREVEDIQEMDIGIMPLPDEPWARGKCGYKLIQYMACGIPVIASPVGVNSEIVEHGVNGFLASTEREWRDAVQQLLDNPALRMQMGQAGRAKIEKEFSIQRYGPYIAQQIQALLSQD